MIILKTGQEPKMLLFLLNIIAEPSGQLRGDGASTEVQSKTVTICGV